MTHRGSVDAEMDLLRHYEPVLRFCRGESFYPINVEPYVERCSLWALINGHTPECLVPSGQLSLDELGNNRQMQAPVEKASPGWIYYLKHDPYPEYPASVALTGQPFDRCFVQAPNRLARVGLFSFLVVWLLHTFRLGRQLVPRSAALAANAGYQQVMSQRQRYSYYGRVIRLRGWTVLQYWLFYFFNDWRSGYGGANDHEADWETISIYIPGSVAWPAQAAPGWVAYASHDFEGHDLLRRWENPSLERVGSHPVVYVAAGSHAAYHAAGEHVARLPVAPSTTPARLIGKANQVLRPGRRDKNNPGGFYLQFIDYARGDGFSLGPSQDKEWDDPHLLDPLPDWAAGYRGLWGMYVGDPFGGENAPTGPVFCRDGGQRLSWRDPVVWAGLDNAG